MTKEQIFEACETGNRTAKYLVERMRAKGMADADMQIAFREMFGISMSATEDAPFCAEFSRDRDAYQRAGFTVESYVAMRRVEEGIDQLAPAAPTAAKPSACPATNWLCSALSEEIFA